MKKNQGPRGLTFGYPGRKIGASYILHADCFEWLGKVPENTIHAVVTDPPYGVKEYDSDQLEKREIGHGGIWRLPPSFDGNKRAPLPRFTALNNKERQRLKAFFVDWSKLLLHALRPGAHCFVASNSFMAQLIFSCIVDGGLEFRGQLIRLVRTLRGGDRPKNAEDEYPEISTFPRGCYEPWGIFRKPLLKNMKVSDCLKQFQTGGLRRLKSDRPFEDVISSGRTPRRERAMANHPSLKPQSFLRLVVYASLPLGKGFVVDPFMGSGSTIAAAEALGLRGIGLERHDNYYSMAETAIPKLAALTPLEFDKYYGGNDYQLDLFPADNQS